MTLTLFHGQNKITSAFGTNHWIPFTEHEVNAKAKFESNFMTDFIYGKIKPTETEDIFSIVREPKEHYEVPLQFSDEAKAVFDAGRNLWRYYHSHQFPYNAGIANSTNGYNANASFYDIRAYFQGRNSKGRMNTKSNDEQYTALIGRLRTTLNVLAKKIEPKIYDYEFLKE